MLLINMKFKTQEQQQYCILHTLFFKSDPEPEAMTDVQWWVTLTLMSDGPDDSAGAPPRPGHEKELHVCHWVPLRSRWSIFQNEDSLTKAKKAQFPLKYDILQESEASLLGLAGSVSQLWAVYAELTNFREPITRVFMSKCLEKYACTAIFKWTLVSLCWCTCVIMPKTEVTNTTLYYYLN